MEDTIDDQQPEDRGSNEPHCSGGLAAWDALHEQTGEDFMGHVCMECGWDTRTHDVLQRLYDKMCPKDSFGVHGSDFQTCRMCHTVGSPTRPWKHADNCEMKEVEELLFGLGEFDA
jgi:hypothetical protein